MEGILFNKNRIFSEENKEERDSTYKSNTMYPMTISKIPAFGHN